MTTAILLLLLVAGLAAGGYFFYQGRSGGTGFFGPKPERRLDVVEQWSLDSRRRLVLIRRDDVEHLIMTGGPVDVVIEGGIGAKPAHEAAEPVAVYNRPARTMGGIAPVRPVAVSGGGE